ncbi:MAG: helix-turn-helix domain-containing protein [Treponema sp.]|nr:helix-turn-helix domain-containing protein [Treponema sp.]
MAYVKEIFAENLKKNRRKLGISQEILAERAGISTHYVSMIEMARNFPKSDVIERLASALEIEVHELFLVPRAPADELEKLHQSIINQIKQTVSESVTSSVESAFKKMTTSMEETKRHH